MVSEEVTLHQNDKLYVRRMAALWRAMVSFLDAAAFETLNF
jgi:hypothetical protein